MFCGNCGQQLKDDAKFCHGCGAPVGGGEVPVTADTKIGTVTGNGGTPTGPRRVRKKKKNLIWIPIAAAAAVLVILIGVLAGTLLGSDSAKLMKAVTKSVNAYTDAWEEVGMPDLSFIADKKAYSAEVGVKIHEIDGDTSMAGIGARLDMDVSLDKREIGLSATPFFGAADLLNTHLKIDNEKVYIGVPELTGDTFYMINTETLGHDLNNLGAGMPELEEFGFNLFDIAGQIEKINAQNEQASEDMKAAFLGFAETIEVEKTGTEEFWINGEDVKCTAYEVVITEEAMADLVDAIEDIYKHIDNVEDYLSIFETMGLPEYAIEELRYELEYEMEYAAEDTAEMFDGLREAVDVLRDVELKVYVSDGYVVGVVYEQRIEGTPIEITLTLGGEENYVDNIDLTVWVDGEIVASITSGGNHTGEGGEFINYTAVSVYEYGEYVDVFTAHTFYTPKAKSDNFSSTVIAGEVEMNFCGQITTTGDSIDMELNDVSIDEYGETIMSIGLDCKIGKYESSSIKTRNSIPLANLNQDQLMNEVSKIEENAMGWMEELIAQFPELMYYLY